MIKGIGDQGPAKRGLSNWVDSQIKKCLEELEVDVPHDQTQKLRGNLQILRRLEKEMQPEVKADNPHENDEKVGGALY